MPVRTGWSEGTPGPRVVGETSGRVKTPTVLSVCKKGNDPLRCVVVSLKGRSESTGCKTDTLEFVQYSFGAFGVKHSPSLPAPQWYGS